MKLKKILASLTAAAMAVTTMAFAPVSVSAADLPDTVAMSMNQPNFILGIDGTSCEITSVPGAKGSDSVTASLKMLDDGYGWSNGQIGTNSSAEGDWVQASYASTEGGGSYVAGSSIEVTLDTYVAEDGSTYIKFEEYGGGILSIEKLAYSNGYEYVPEADHIALLHSQTGTSLEITKVAGAAGATSVTANLVMVSDGYGWSNGQIGTNSSAEGDWVQTSYASTEGGGSYVSGNSIEATLDTYVAEDGSTYIKFEEYGGGTILVKSLVYDNGYTLNAAALKDIPVESVTITPATLNLTVGEEETLTAAVLPENATDKTVVWSSSDETVATVDENGKVKAIAEGDSIIITATAGDKTAECKVTVSAKTYPITVKSNDETMGTAFADETEASEGTAVLLTAEAKDGYRFVKWESEQVEFDGDYFEMPGEAVTVTAIFEKDAYPLNIIAENGTVTAEADGEAVDGEAAAGSTIKLTPKADEGYRFVKWESEEVEIEDDSFIMPEGEVTVTAVFEADTYALTITAENGTVTAKADGAAVDGEAVAGSKVVLDKTADEGYKFDKWISDDVTIVDDSFTMPAKDVAIEAVFVEMEADEFNITVDKNIENGTVAVKGGATAAKAGDTITLSVTPDTGCELVSLTVNGEAIEGTSFTMPEKDVVISAVFKKTDYTVTVSESENGKVSADKATAQYGDTVTLTAVPEEGYALVSYETTPKDLAISENGTFKMPAEDVEIKAVFARDTFKVTVLSSENGTISVDKYSAKPGDTVTVTVTPNEDYKVHAICVNDEAIEGNSFTMPAEDVVVSVIFESEGSADTSGGVSPGGITVDFEDHNAVLEAIFGENWLELVESGEKLSVEMTVLDEVPAEDKTTVEDYLSDDQYLGVILDIDLIKTVNGTSSAVTESSKPITFSIEVPADIIAEGRTYSVVRVHDGAAQNIGGTFDSETNTITVSSDKFSTYAIVYDEAPVEEEPLPAVKYSTVYSITADSHVRTGVYSASAGTAVSINVDFGYDAIVYCNGAKIAKITDRGTFTMPAGNVRIVSVENGYLAMIRKAAPNSYIFVYDTEMNYIKTNGSRKGIEGEGTITVKLGEEYAGKTVTLYKGRKSTAVELDSAVLDENGNATFTVEGGKNYTAVVE